ncbi:MAG: 30S ribosomal protein S4 [Candidatus Thermoplasmatota archaeon]|nr:30S ribosomal protein S4 [Candidatus Thermoplasmatota archaeon]MCL5731142.1 30S ribosomal protein S4 [Candidatus Thermoplasmatota archaeon]
MGDPKFKKKTYSTPRHPWDKTRIDFENELVFKYGLKNKRELWKAQSILDSFRTQARLLQARMRINDPGAQVSFQKLVGRLNRYKILGSNATLDDILSLSIDSILERRLQTLVHKKNLARTPSQSRQLITHGHIVMGGRRTSIPGILVEASSEDTIGYFPRSPLADEDHPVRKSFEHKEEEDQKISSAESETETNDETEGGEK